MIDDRRDLGAPARVYMFIMGPGVGGGGPVATVHSQLADWIRTRGAGVNERDWSIGVVTATWA